MYPHLNTNPSHMVAEQCSDATRIAHRIVDVLVPLIMEEIIERARSISQEHINRRIIDEVLHVFVPQDDDDKDQLSSTDPRIEAVEKSIAELHESVMKETEARQRQHSKVMTQEVMIPVVRPYPEYVDAPYANPIMQAVEKTLDVPQVQYTDRIVGVLAVTQCRVPTIQTAHGTVEVPKVQIIDRTVGVPVVIQRQTTQETVEVPKTVSQDRIPQRAAEQAIDAPRLKH